MAKTRKGGSAASMRFAHDEEVVERVEGAGELDEQDELESRQQFVVLLRHGVAEERTDEKPDSDRSLTKEGIQKMKKISRGLAELFPDADLLLSSPLVRCVQTALWVAKSYDQKIEIRTADELMPGATPAAYLALLKRVQLERVVIVAHEPDLTNCMLALASLESRSDLQLKKGGAYGLNISARGGSLQWMLTPRILRKLG